MMLHLLECALALEKHRSSASHGPWTPLSSQW